MEAIEVLSYLQLTFIWLPLLEFLLKFWMSLIQDFELHLLMFLVFQLLAYSLVRKCRFILLELYVEAPLRYS